MALNLRHRSFLKELDLTPAEFRFLLDLSARLKAARAAAPSNSACAAGTSR